MHKYRLISKKGEGTFSEAHSLAQDSIASVPNNAAQIERVLNDHKLVDRLDNAIKSFDMAGGLGICQLR